MVAKGTQFAYLCMTSALATRIAMALLSEFALPLMDVAAAPWVLTFAEFQVVCAAMLIRRSQPC